jgi:DNA-binding transcriptional ArsR family regulator
MMAHSIIHQATSVTSWRILSLLRLGQRRIYMLKRALGMSESAFSHAISKLETAGLVTIRRMGREKIAILSAQGRIVFASLQALCFTLGGTDGTDVEDDSALLRCLRESPQADDSN